MHELRPMLPAYRCQDANRFRIDLKGQLGLHFRLVDSGICGTVDANVGLYRPEEIPDQFEMMYGQILPGEEGEIQSGVIPCDLPQCLSQLTVCACDQYFHFTYELC